MLVTQTSQWPCVSEGNFLHLEFVLLTVLPKGEGRRPQRRCWVSYSLLIADMRLFQTSLVDLMFQAWGHGVVQTLVVITSDRDLSYALATLRMKDFCIILISPANSHVDLVSQATIHLDWSRTVLGIKGSVYNEKDLFQDPPAVGSATPGGPPLLPSSVAPPPASTKFEYGTRNLHFPLEPNDFPSQSREYKSPTFSGRDAGFGVFDLHSVYMTSPKTMASIGLGDGPLFPRPKSTDSKTVKLEAFLIDDVPGSLHHSLSESSFRSRNALTTKAKEKDSSSSRYQDEIAPPPPSGSTLAPLDEDDGTTLRGLWSLDNPPRDVSASTTSGSSSQSTTFSFVQVPTASTAPTSAKMDEEAKPAGDALGLPLPQDSNPSSVTSAFQNSVLPRGQSNDSLPPVSAAVPEQRAQTSTPSIPRTMAPAQRLPSAIPVQRPQASTPSIPRNLAPAQTLPSAVNLPPAWIPLIQTLRKHNGVLRRNIIAPELLRTNLRAFEIASTNRIVTYLQAAMTAGIVGKEVRSGGVYIVLNPKYMS